MDIDNLKQVIEAHIYAANWEKILKDYYTYFDEIEEYFPKRFIKHFSKNHHYHDWLLENISIVNVNKNTRRPDFTLQLSHGDSRVTMRFENVVSLHINGDFMSCYTGHGDILDTCAFIKQDQLFSCHCLFSFGLKILITYKKMIWSIENKP